MNNAARSVRMMVLGVFLVLGFVLSSATAQVVQVPGANVPVVKWKGVEVMADEALVQFEEGVSTAERAALHRALGCALIEAVAPDLDRVELNGRSLDEAIATYEKDPRVVLAQPNYVYRTFFTPNDPSWNVQWGPKNIKCPAAWDIHKGGNSVVAILDSSVDYTHEDLAAHYVYGHDFYNGDNDPYDFLDFIGHGTHCSGIAAAVTNNGKGIAGVGFNSGFAFYQVGSVIFISDSAVIQAVNDVVSRGWQVISMSFGGSSQSPSMKSALQNAYNAGVVCVAAAGNNGDTQVMYPAGYSFVLSVASHNQNNQKSSFSTYGSWVDVSAPGENIYSTIYMLWGSYTYMDGTSMACPHVAGAANILYSLIGGQRNPVNRDLVIQALEDTAVPASWVKYGRVDLEAAMQQLTAQPPVIYGVSPAVVQAFMGGTITLTGDHFTGATQVNSGGTVLVPPDFTVVDDEHITYDAPTANALGTTQVTVTNAAGTSNPGTFTYVETDPPKLSAPAVTQAGAAFTWAFGGGVGDGYLLIIAADPTTFPYQGFDVLANFFILTSGYLDAVGLDSFGLTIPNGLQGLTFYSQVLTFDPGFHGASNIASTLITN